MSSFSEVYLGKQTVKAAPQHSTPFPLLYVLSLEHLPPSSFLCDLTLFMFMVCKLHKAVIFLFCFTFVSLAATTVPSIVCITIIYSIGIVLPIDGIGSHTCSVPSVVFNSLRTYGP